MPDYQLTLAAEHDLTEIYTYTYSEFGETRADSYLESLQDCISMLADNPKLGIDVSPVRTGYRRFVHQRHAVYYKVTRAGILVVRILGPGMLSESRLP